MVYMIMIYMILANANTNSFIHDIGLNEKKLAVASIGSY